MFIHLSVQWDNGQMGGSVPFTYFMFQLAIVVAPKSSHQLLEEPHPLFMWVLALICNWEREKEVVRPRLNLLACNSPELEQKWQLATVQAQSSRCRSLVPEVLMWCSDLMEQSCSASRRLRSDDLPACCLLSEGPSSGSSLKCIFKWWKIITSYCRVTSYWIKKKKNTSPLGWDALLREVAEVLFLDVLKMLLDQVLCNSA